VIEAWHSVRKDTVQQISREDMEQILKAGNFTPNAGCGQRSMLVGIRNKELAAKIGILNLVGFDRSRLADSYVSKKQPSVIDDAAMKYGGVMVRRLLWQSLSRTAFCFVLRMLSALQRIRSYRLRDLGFPPASFPVGRQPL